jgi:hypothetical protein
MVLATTISLTPEWTVPLCCCSAWALVFLLGHTLWIAARDGIWHLQRLHQIPCHRCRYFTDDYRLKCTVHPCKALTDRAIDCVDYEPAKLSSFIHSES